MNRIKSLEKKIKEAQKAYFNNEPIMDDDQYDSLIDELASLDRNSPVLKTIGFEPEEDSRLKKVKHTIPMGSLNKVNSEDEFLAWVKKTGAKGLVMQEKLDGISVEIIYKNGKFKQAISRGDGVTGEDISHNVRCMNNVCGALPGKFTGHLRGEIFMKKSTFESHYSDKKNPRNVASGIARRKTVKGAEDLNVRYFNCICDDKSFETEADKYYYMQYCLNIAVATYELVNVEKAIKWYERYQDNTRDKLDYEIDALVVKINSLELQEKLGIVDGRPKDQVAWKFASEMRETKINEVSWEIGLTGRITPVAHLEPVEIGGVTISKASLHNVKNMQNLKAGPGALVLVSRRNDVIPYIEKVIKEGGIAFVPEECPACDIVLQWQGEFLVCPNKLCPAKLFGDLQKWVAVTEIDDVGPEFLKTIIEEGFVLNVSDLYVLSTVDLLSLPGFKMKKTNKVLSNIKASKELPLAVFLSALNIPGIGMSTFETIIKEEGADLDFFLNTNPDYLTKFDGVGLTVADMICDGIKDRKSVIKELLEKGVKIMDVPEAGFDAKRGKLVGMSFCFTGALEIKRAEAQKMVKDLGGECKSSVSKGLTYLIQADPDSQSTKAKKARGYGTKVISEKEFLKVIGG